ncbi:precorrin-6A/cobalt-precorrin-6A reductase [Streptomyces sp. NPDC058001]|uniref:precorrin-6A/cobalt-precorrin-6A reductase n=1 Tax=Streptomyces sp. NPDC058001 TaxID=3346300 RepID=UPI0036E775E7
MTALIVGSTRLADELVMAFEYGDPDYVHLAERDADPDALAAAFRTTAVGAVINAAQPFATELTAAVAAACAAAGLPLLRALPPSLARIAGSARWRWIDSLAAAGRAAHDCPGDVLVVLHPPDLVLPGWDREPARRVYGLGGALSTIDERHTQLLIAADSGDDDTGYYLKAAEARGLDVVIVRRPHAAGSVSDASAAFAWLNNVHTINSVGKAEQ